jgi:hypothetical protein
MKQLNATQDKVVLLTADQVAQVAGGISISPSNPRRPGAGPVRQHHVHEDYMNWTAREHDPAGGDSIHDFPAERASRDLRESSTLFHHLSGDFLTNLFTSDRGEPAADALNFEGEQGRTMQVLTPAETAQVSGGVWLLYWLITQPAY